MANELEQRARELLAAEFRVQIDNTHADAILRGDYDGSPAIRAIVAALQQAQQPDDDLADTQRAIIEAAERRGYERGLKDAQQQLGAQGAVASVWFDNEQQPNFDWTPLLEKLNNGKGNVIKLFAAPALPEVSATQVADAVVAAEKSLHGSLADRLNQEYRDQIAAPSNPTAPPSAR